MIPGQVVGPSDGVVGPNDGVVGPNDGVVGPNDGVVGPDDPIVLNAGRAAITLRVENTGDRPVQVGSHFHFFEANEALAFDRDAARGFRLDVPAGTAVRFEPGIAAEVSLVAIGGRRVVAGLRGLIGGPLDDGTDRAAAGAVDG